MGRAARPADIFHFGDHLDERGLVPVVVQEATTGAVLLLAYMNAEALEATLRTGRAHFWSRSRGRLWRKGERSGREQIVEALYINCEQNSLLLPGSRPANLPRRQRPANRLLHRRPRRRHR